MANRTNRDRTSEHAVTVEGQQRLRDAVRQLGPHQAAAHAQRGEVSLVAESLGELQAAAEDRPRVEIYDRVLLTYFSPYAIFREGCGAIGRPGR